MKAFRDVRKNTWLIAKKYKPYILKYKALISKYMPCIFCLFKSLIHSNLQKFLKFSYLLDLQPVTNFPLKRGEK